jgi:hypothetical protein
MALASTQQLAFGFVLKVPPMQNGKDKPLR